MFSKKYQKDKLIDLSRPFRQQKIRGSIILRDTEFAEVTETCEDKTIKIEDISALLYIDKVYNENKGKIEINLSNIEKELKKNPRLYLSPEKVKKLYDDPKYLKKIKKAYYSLIPGIYDGLAFDPLKKK